MLVTLPLAVGLGQLTLAKITQDVDAERLLYLYGYIQLLSALGAAVAVPLYLTRMTRRIRAGQLGFVSEEG